MPEELQYFTILIFLVLIKESRLQILTIAIGRDNRLMPMTIFCVFSYTL